jgi:hypothetical protein
MAADARYGSSAAAPVNVIAGVLVAGARVGTRARRLVTWMRSRMIAGVLVAGARVGT